LEIIYVNNENRESHLAEVEPCVMSLGFFDGVHLGHQQVIHTAKKAARENQLTLACMTFFPHPKEVLSKGNEKVEYLMPMVEKQRVLRQQGVEKFYIVQFDPEFASLSPGQFVHKYLLDYGAKYVVAGFDFTYGSRGAGNMARMKTDANNLLETISVEKVEFNGEKISSTLIRKLISTGKLERIHHYLGEHYQMQGKMRLTSKTAEFIAESHYLIPASGVYEVAVTNGRQTWKLEALVEDEQVKLFLDMPKSTQIIRIVWLKRLSSKLVSSFPTSQYVSVLN
jgi:riboflavin kinase/FMN adenylyltransferase